MSDDVAQLRRYAREGAEDAFAELVARHLPLVYSTALRQVGGDAHLAQDVAQTVFMVLARNAASLCRRGIIAGWLYTTTCFIAAKTVRGERRRQAREQASAAVQESQSPPFADADCSWVDQVLDDAMARLSRTDRNAVLLRFFQNQDLKTVGVTLGISEDAARMRVNRALDSLRELLGQRGVLLPAAVLGTTLSSQAVGAVPAGLAATITGNTLASAAAGAGAATSLLKILLMAKLKIGIVGVAMAVAVVAPWVIIQRQAESRLQEEVQALRLKGDQMDQIQAENARLSNLVAHAGSSSSLDESQLSELLRLRGEVGQLRRQASEAKKLQTENRRLQTALSGAQGNSNSENSREEELNIQLPRASWAFAGYNTPEAALQSLLWARREGDFKSVLASLTPDFVEQARKAWGDQIEEQINAELPYDRDRFSNCHISKKEVLSESEVKLYFQLDESAVAFGPNGTRARSLGCGITVKRSGNEWKLEP